MVNFLPTSDAGLTILWLIVSIVAIIEGKMWRKGSTSLGEQLE